MPSAGEEIKAAIIKVAEEHFGEVLSCEVVGTTTSKVVLAKGVAMKVRWSGINPAEMWQRQQLANVPRTLAVLKGEGRPFVFIEWWQGESFPNDFDEVCKLPPDYFRMYGNFIKQVNWRGLHEADHSWRNLLYCPDRRMVINCDVHRLVHVDVGYKRKLMYSLPEEHQAAFWQGYRTTREDVLDLGKTMGLSMEGPHYQPVDVADVHIPGKRSPYRFEVMQWDSFAGMSVLDIGCSHGQCCFEAARRGAKYVLGIDPLGEAPYKLIVWNNALAAYAGYDLDFQAFGMGDPLFLSHVKGRRWDAIFCFAVTGHVPDTAAMMRYIDGATDLLYHEGRLDQPKRDIEDFLRRTTTFSNVEYLGNASARDLTGATRHVYRCTR